MHADHVRGGVSVSRAMTRIGTTTLVYLKNSKSNRCYTEKFSALPKVGQKQMLVRELPLPRTLPEIFRKS